MQSHNINPDILYMQRCIQLAECGKGNVAPNPMVGSVIVYNGHIIGEGFHQQYGQAHAEVNAINSVKDRSLLERATIYVSLEPCAHYGKTPPCADLIIASKIPKVIIGCVDTFSEVSGKGIEKLKAAGIEVVTGILQAECRELNKRFFTFHEQKRPYVILKWAHSIDGFIGKTVESNAAISGGIKISNSLSQTLVHKWRTEEQAIMVGTNTALNDNPQLNARLWKGKTPVRLVLDKNLRLPATLALFDKSVHTIIFNALKSETVENMTFTRLNFDHNIPEQIAKELYKLQIQSVIIEGGAQLLQSFIEAGLWDEARIFTGNILLSEGVKAPVIKGDMVFRDNVSGDKLIVLRNNSLQPLS